MNGDDRGPVEIDIEKAHAARVYNYLLGGVDNFEVDRDLAAKANEGLPGGLDGARANVRANRDFVGRRDRRVDRG